MEQPRTRPRAVVVGGGAGGLLLAIRLARLQRGKLLDVALVDKSETHIWKPLLHEVASGSLYPSADEIDYFALARWHGFTFHHGAFEGLDRENRLIHVAAVHDRDCMIIPPRQVPYDLAIMALGSVTNDFGIPGVKEHTYSLDNAGEAAEFHRTLVNSCLRANYAEPEQRPECLNIVIVGGGATGVELAAELRSSLRVITQFRLENLDADSFVRLMILNLDPRVLAQLPERISEAITEELGNLGISVRNSEQVVRVDQTHIETKSGNRYPADLAVWAAGVKAPECLRNIAGLETDRLDRLVVTEMLQTTRDPRVLAMGDCAAAPWGGKKGKVPPRAQAANQQARYIAKAIPRILAKKPLKPFHYNDFGSLVSLGEENAIGTLMGYVSSPSLRVEGFIARLIYRWLYKRHQAALYGWSSAILATIGNWLRGTTRPRVKLH